MSLPRIQRLLQLFVEQLPRVPDSSSVWSHERQLGLELLESMLRARHLDYWAHELRRLGVGHYTICSSGHEANAVLGRLTRADDPSLVHYRSAAFQLERCRQVGRSGVAEIALSLVASSAEPVSGGRHKVFGGKDIGVLPATSTIASHLPRAVGLATALERIPRLGLPHAYQPDAIAVASFGDASLNHSTAVGAMNAAGWVVHQRLKLPLIFLCEDNGLGISVRTPSGWVEERLRALPHIEYHVCDSQDLDGVYRVMSQAVLACRTQRKPQAIHLRCVRLLGHAGSDVDTVYRTPGEIVGAEGRDPVLHAAWQLVRSGISVEEILQLERAVQREVAAACEAAQGAPRISSTEQVMEALEPLPVSELPAPPSPPKSEGAAASEPLTLAQGINLALKQALDVYPEALVFGEDVAKKGGVYGITKGLLAQAGPARVFNTLLDEQTILGMALGAGSLGMLPMAEIQYLAYLHNAEDQLRGEAASMSFFSNKQYLNPMFVRIAGLAYQKGFGGHFHNDNSLAVLRDIPGLVLGVPVRADDALELFRTGLHLAKAGGKVVCMVEPIALYHTRDLYEAGDGAWLAKEPAGAADFARGRVYNPQAKQLTMISYGNGVLMSLRVADQLKQLGIAARVLDLRWLAPLPEEDIVEQATATGRVLMVDECRKSGGLGEAIAALLLEQRARFGAEGLRWRRVSSQDSFIPLGDAANLVLLDEGAILKAALLLMQD